MGCCASESRGKAEILLAFKIKQAIEEQRLDALFSYFVIYLKLPACVNDKVDSCIIPVNNIKLNALGYSLWLGREKTFKYLFETMEADAKVMEDIFFSLNLSGIDVICEKGYIDLLKYYMPIYEDICPSLEVLKKPLTTIQKTCEDGNINVISCIHSYFKDKFYVPDNLNVHYINEETNENCALIACRTANYPVIKFLYESCNANFKIVNAKGQNAIELLLSSDMVYHKYQGCFKYINKTIGIPIPSNFHCEETRTIRTLPQSIEEAELTLVKSKS